MEKYVIIMAGGSGIRMGSATPKQFLLLDGKPVIMHSINRFLEYDPEINLVIVLPEANVPGWYLLCKKFSFNHKHTVVAGGDERFYSVKNGLLKATGKSLIAIHDAVRPLVSAETISRCFETAQLLGNAIPVIAPPESVRETGRGEESHPLNRENIRLVQTPQVFRSDIIKKAYDCGYSPEYTDDATVVERLGIKINMVEGNYGNIKITTPDDIIIAEALIKNG